MLCARHTARYQGFRMKKTVPLSSRRIGAGREDRQEDVRVTPYGKYLCTQGVLCKRRTAQLCSKEDFLEEMASET